MSELKAKIKELSESLVRFKCLLDQNAISGNEQNVIRELRKCRRELAISKKSGGQK